MSSSKLIRLSGLAAILGVVLSVIAVVAGSMDNGNSISASATSASVMISSGLWLLSGMLILAGLIGFYARQSEGAGTLGLVGFIAAFVGTVLQSGSYWNRLFDVPWIATEAPTLLNAHPMGTGVLIFGVMLSTIAMAVGWLLFGISAFRARVYPRIPTVLLIIGAVLFAAPLPGVTLLFSVAVVWLGVVLFTGERTASGRIVPVS